MVQESIGRSTGFMERTEGMNPHYIHTFFKPTRSLGLSLAADTSSLLPPDLERQHSSCYSPLQPQKSVFLLISGDEVLRSPLFGGSRPRPRRFQGTACRTAVYPDLGDAPQAMCAIFFIILGAQLTITSPFSRYHLFRKDIGCMARTLLVWPPASISVFILYRITTFSAMVSLYKARERER